jgi:hypothetical protein
LDEGTDEIKFGVGCVIDMALSFYMNISFARHKLEQHLVLGSVNVNLSTTESVF